MTILLCDPRVAAVPVLDCAEPVIPLHHRFGRRLTARCGIADRLAQAEQALPAGYLLRVYEGFRQEAAQRAIIARYSAELRRQRPGASADLITELSSRFVAPLAVAPHVAGAALDLTLTDADGIELDLGTPLDATPEESNGACYFAARVSTEARHHRAVLARAMHSSGFVNYPTEWWHWSYGDRYWALTTGASHARYGAVRAHGGSR